MSTTPSHQNKAVMLWLQGMLFLVLVASIGCASSSLPKQATRSEPNVLFDIYEWDDVLVKNQGSTNPPVHVYSQGHPVQSISTDTVTSSVSRIYTNGTFFFTWNRGTLERPRYTSTSGNLPDEIRVRILREFVDQDSPSGKRPPIFSRAGETVRGVGSDRDPLPVAIVFRYLKGHYQHSCPHLEVMDGLKTYFEWDDWVYSKRHPTAP